MGTLRRKKNCEDDKLENQSRCIYMLTELQGAEAMSDGIIIYSVGSVYRYKLGWSLFSLLCTYNSISDDCVSAFLRNSFESFEL